MRHIIDKGIGKFASRKLIAFIIATVYLALALVSEDAWVIVTTVYIGGQSAVDITERIIRARAR